MKPNCAQAAGRARAIHGRIPRCAPTSGSTAWASAMHSARISAIWPISGIMGDLRYLLWAAFCMACPFITASLTSGGM